MADFLSSCMLRNIVLPLVDLKTQIRVMCAQCRRSSVRQRADGMSTADAIGSFLLVAVACNDKGDAVSGVALYAWS